jgi:dipeptidyl aminopeptidase/acylaminoacyl peptidase
MNATRLSLCAALVGAALAWPVHAQQVVLGKEAYLPAPKEIADVVATRGDMITLTNISPDGKKFLITKNDGMPSVQRLGCPHVILGEVAFDHLANRAHDLWVRSNAGYELFFVADKRIVPVQVPTPARVSTPVWSPDGSKLAYFAHFDDATHIYVADADTGSSRRLTVTPVLATLATSFQWSKDGKRIQTVLLPDDGKREMPKREPGSEPKVRVTRGGANPSRTYRFLLDSPYDMKLLEHLGTGHVAVIDVADGRVTKIGEPSLVRSVSMSPNEESFRVTTMKKPFSYYVPMVRFGQTEGIWSQEGKSLYTILDRNLRETDIAAPARTAQAPAGARGGFGGRQGGQGRAQQGQPGQQPQLDPNQPDPNQPPPDPNQPPPDPNRPPADPTQPQPPDPDPDNPNRFTPQVDPNAKRDIAWRPDCAGLSCLQMEPEKPDSKDPRRDQVLQLVPPYGKDDVKVVYAAPNRIISLQYSDDCHMIFLTQTVNSQRQITAIDLKDDNKEYVIYRTGETPPADNPNPPPEFDDDEQPPAGRGRGGQAGNAGTTLLTRPSRSEARVVRISSTGDVYLSGSDRARGAGGAPPKPYLDKVNIKTGQKTRIFEGKGELLESIDAVDADDVNVVFTTRQKADVPPNSFMIDLKSGNATQLTENADHNPWFHKLKTERIQFTRCDGFRFSGRVTLPPDAKGKLPAIFWIYPREYTDQAAYNAGAGRGQGGGGPGGAGGGRFQAPAPRSMTLLTLLGYAVVEPDIPIVGPPGRMNDNYVSDLRNGLWAVIDELDKRGIIDRDRLAVGGHSYGAFSTANALAHTPFFKAGIAGDGNYNRTLTMMTFQTERRQFWDARETYLEMSPVLWANRVNGALLMYHGMDDANVGTNPTNAEQMFLALDGLGKPAALYMYPFEGHGPLAKETTNDLWARWTIWLDTYVKNPKKETPRAGAATTERSGGEK